MIHLQDLALEAPDGRLLMEELDLHVPKGGNFLLVGPSGSGKSRLLKVIAGVESPARGQVKVGGRTIWPGDGALALIGHVRMGLAFSSGGLLSNLSLRGNLILPLRFRGVSEGEIQARVDAVLERLGIQAVAGLRPHAVSECARKHGNLARILATDPDLILLDDPLEGLDTADRGTALGVIQEWAENPNKTLLVAQEEPGSLAELATGCLKLNALPIPLEVP